MKFFSFTFQPISRSLLYHLDHCINSDGSFVNASMANSAYHTFPEGFELQFGKAFRLLKVLGCDYFYFIGTDTGLRHRFCTDENWIDFYAAEKFIFNDPLKRIAESSTFIALPWQQVTHLHGNDKKTMSARTSFGLHNGLTIAKEHQNRKYIFALATELKEHDLARYLLLQNIDTLEKIILDCMRVFDQYLLLMNNPVSSVM